MMHVIEKDEHLITTYNKKKIEERVSSVFSTFQSLGEMMGPIINSVLVSIFHFTRAHEIISNYLLIYAAAYFVICGNFSMFIFSKKDTTNDEEERTSLVAPPEP